jgi:hypothetical protein
MALESNFASSLGDLFEVLGTSMAYVISTAITHEDI